MLRTSKSVTKIAPALIACQGSFPAVLRDRDNSAYESKFSDLASLIKATRPKLRKNGLAVLQAPSSDVEKETVMITTRLQHTSGQFYESDLVLPIFDEDWANGELTGQVVSSAVSYGCRIAYKAILGIANPDDDGNAASRIPPDYKRTDGKKPGTHPAVVTGELLEVRESPQDNGQFYARLRGVPPKLYLIRKEIQLQLEKVLHETVELECKVSDYIDFWEVVRILKVGNYDFTQGNEDLSQQLQASVHIVKHNIEPPAITPDLFRGQEDPF